MPCPELKDCPEIPSLTLLTSVWHARLCGSTAVSLTCQALWHAVPLSVWCVRLCGSTAVSLTCQALWQYYCQSHVPGFVAVLLSVWWVRLWAVLPSVWCVGLCGRTSVSLICQVLWWYYCHVMYKPTLTLGIHMNMCKSYQFLNSTGICRCCSRS